MSELNLKLTPKQLAELEPIFNALSDLNIKETTAGKDRCSIVAQIYRDGMCVRVLNSAETTAVRKALGTKSNLIRETLAEK